eukprot:scaffold98_cov244-Pinguiococcus_pyrenoidosus.AAC.5
MQVHMVRILGAAEVPGSAGACTVGKEARRAVLRRNSPISCDAKDDYTHGRSPIGCPEYLKNTYTNI